jgi:hypothetical protein
MAIEIVDLPINSMVISHSYVSLPEGIHQILDEPSWSLLLDMVLSGNRLPQSRLMLMVENTLIFPIMTSSYLILWKILFCQPFNRHIHGEPQPKHRRSRMPSMAISPHRRLRHVIALWEQSWDFSRGGWEHEIWWTSWIEHIWTYLMDTKYL